MSKKIISNPLFWETSKRRHRYWGMCLKMGKIINENKNFVCINCGIGIDELYKTYSASILKIIDCVCILLKIRILNLRLWLNNWFVYFWFLPQEHCKDTADKYIEFEPIIIVIDLCLISAPVYRHVLYNNAFEVSFVLLWFFYY